MAGFDSERRRRRFEKASRRDQKRYDRSFKVLKLAKERKREERLLAAMEVGTPQFHPVVL